jgi:hypothetical protein
LYNPRWPEKRGFPQHIGGGENLEEALDVEDTGALAGVSHAYHKIHDVLARQCRKLRQLSPQASSRQM